MKEQDDFTLTIVSRNSQGALHVKQVRGEEIWPILVEHILAPPGAAGSWLVQVARMEDGYRIKILTPDTPTLTLTRSDELTFYVDDLECV